MRACAWIQKTFTDWIYSIPKNRFVTPECTGTRTGTPRNSLIWCMRAWKIQKLVTQAALYEKTLTIIFQFRISVIQMFLLKYCTSRSIWLSCECIIQRTPPADCLRKPFGKACRCAPRRCQWKLLGIDFRNTVPIHLTGKTLLAQKFMQPCKWCSTWFFCRSTESTEPLSKL